MAIRLEITRPDDLLNLTVEGANLSAPFSPSRTSRSRRF
jgi:hypothetical protein